MGNEMLLKVMDDSDGNPVDFDLKTHGNLLLCGGSMYGRTIFLHSLIYQLVCSMRRKDVRFLVMAVEDNPLLCYEDLPQLEMPVLTHPMECARMLMWIVHEMEERYKIFKRVRVSNFEEFNGLSFDEKVAEYDSSEDMPVPNFMPRLVVVAVDLYIFLEGYQEWIMHALALLNNRSLAAGIHLIFSQPQQDEITMERLAVYGFSCCVSGDFPNVEGGNAEELHQDQKLKVGVALENKSESIPGTFSYDEVNIMQWVHGVSNASRVREAFINESGIVSSFVANNYLTGDEDLGLLRGLTETDSDVSDRLIFAAARLIRRIKIASTHTLSLNLGISSSKTIALMDRLERLNLISGAPGKPKKLNQDLILDYIRNAKQS